MRLSGLDAPAPVIGLFPGRDLKIEEVAGVARTLRDRFQSCTVHVRWHPHTGRRKIARASRAIRHLPGVRIAAPRLSLAETVSRCDWAVGGASNVHLEVLSLGVPSILLMGIDYMTDHDMDAYGFIAGGILPTASVAEEIDPVSMRAFFQRDEWPARYREFDWGYERDGEAIRAEVRDAVLGTCLGERAFPADLPESEACAGKPP